MTPQAEDRAGSRRRIACVDLPVFPLQILAHRHPDWGPAPAVVVDKDKPQGVILWSNERARAFRILPGMRFAAALSLARDLRADVVESESIEAHVTELVETLQRFTPNVEPREGEPGVFWLDASGLGRLYPSLDVWAERMHAALTKKGFLATVVVGFTRMGTHAVSRFLHSGSRIALSGERLADSEKRARTPMTPSSPTASARDPADSDPGLESRAHWWVFETPGEERRVAARVPLARLGIDPRTRDALSRLGVSTLGQFLRLPRAGVKRRFGLEAYALHRAAAGDLETPLVASPHREALREEMLLDYPVEDLSRIVLVVETLLDSLMTRLTARNASLAGVTLTLGFELSGARRTETLQPAVPTRDGKHVLQLIALRLGSSFAAEPPLSGVIEMVLEADGVSSTREQLDLFAEKPRRDLAAAGRALSRLRAELGEESVLRARVREGHLPEARVTWEPMKTLSKPHPVTFAMRPLVRRLLDRPVPLPERPRHEPDGWLIAGFGAGAVSEVCGPHVISGGWWMRRIERRYHYARTTDGRWLWVYEDVARRRWFLQGMVE